MAPQGGILDETEKSMKSANGINLTMLCDFYELTMGNGYFADGMKDRVCYFDMFFRSVPDQGGYAVAAGLEQIVDYTRTCTSAKKTSRICAAAASSAKNSSII